MLNHLNSIHMLNKLTTRGLIAFVILVAAATFLAAIEIIDQRAILEIAGLILGITVGAKTQQMRDKSEQNKGNAI